MNKCRLLFFIIVFYSCAGMLTAQNIVVNDTYTAQQLVENVLMNTTCANSANYAVIGDTFSGSSKSYGYFSYSGTTFPFSEGIVLSTSRAVRTQGPNSNLIDEGNINWPGDADLEQALGITGTFNATILEFDFTPLTDKISFDYLFASEEYHGNALCQYSDGFAFLLRPAGSTGPYQNLALVPNTTIPVKVTSVHPAVSGNNGCNAENEAYFGGFNSVNYPINFDGQTIVMTAKATVTPGVIYHIKLVIADEENIRYDSAIFLDAGSFNAGIDLGPDRLIATNNPLCFGETLTLNGTLFGASGYQWFKNGTLLLGATNPTYTVTTTGNYTVEVTLNSATTCVTTGAIEIEYSALPLLYNQTIVQCDPDLNGITTFNLTQVNSLVTGGDPLLSSVTYYSSLANAQSHTNPITNPVVYQNTTTNQVFASVSNAFGCYNEATIDLVISNNIVAPQNPFEKCDADGNLDGFAAFDLDLEISPTVLIGISSGLSVAYYASQNDAVIQSNSLPTNYTNVIANQQTIFARIVNGSDCYGIIPILLQVLVFNPPQLQDEIRYLCENSTINLTVTSGYTDYIWSNGTTTNSISVSQSGSYAVTISNASGCQKTKNFTVIDSEVATINSIQINDFDGYNNTVEINVSGSGDYEFSLNGSLYQDSPIFTNVAPNVYLVYVKDKNRCGIVSKQITVLDYPRFFTPNGDGINDVWSVKNIRNLSNTKITIFDRYGQLVYSFNEKQNGWNGRTNQNDILATDYWFVIEFQDRNTVKGHFSLKR